MRCSTCQPKRVLIVGGGYIAVEFVGIFHGLGSEVTLAYRGKQILRGFNDDLRSHLHDEMAQKGVRILLHTDVTGIDTCWARTWWVMTRPRSL